MHVSHFIVSELRGARSTTSWQVAPRGRQGDPGMARGRRHKCTASQAHVPGSRVQASPHSEERCPGSRAHRTPAPCSGASPRSRLSSWRRRRSPAEKTVPARLPVHLRYPHRRQLPRRAQVFMHWLADQVTPRLLPWDAAHPSSLARRPSSARIRHPRAQGPPRRIPHDSIFPLL